MFDWNFFLYLYFFVERLCLVVELFVRVSLENVEYVVDFGCGLGNSIVFL